MSFLLILVEGYVCNGSFYSDNVYLRLLICIVFSLIVYRDY